MHLELLVLRLVHVLCGTFWVGSGVYTAVFFVPALTSSGVNPGPLFAALGRRRIFVVLPAVALLTMASGFRLLWIASGGALATYASSPSGSAYAWSGVAAVVAFLLSTLVSRPSAARAGRLTAALQSGAPDRDALTMQLATIRRRASVSSAAAISLLVLCAVGMSVGRYL